MTRDEYVLVYEFARDVARKSRRRRSPEAWHMFLRAKLIAQMIEGQIGQLSSVPAEEWRATGSF